MCENDEFISNAHIGGLDLSDQIKDAVAGCIAIDEQTPENCLDIVNACGNELQFVREQTEELCMAAVLCDGEAIAHVKNQTPELCLAAVKENGFALQFVKEQTPEICLAVVKQNSFIAVIVEPSIFENIKDAIFNIY